MSVLLATRAELAKLRGEYGVRGAFEEELLQGPELEMLNAFARCVPLLRDLPSATATILGAGPLPVLHAAAFYSSSGRLKVLEVCAKASNFGGQRYYTSTVSLTSEKVHFCALDFSWQTSAVAFLFLEFHSS